jgi:hypothetical protein
VGDHINKNEIGSACDMYRRQRRCIQGGEWREKGHLEDLGLDGRIILKLILRS